LFDERSARAFIGGSLDARHERAFERCYHPAMQADYFRLCYLFVEGGFYVDADDICVGAQIGWLFDDGRLQVQPLCYDVVSGTMVNPSAFLHIDAHNPSWIFYFNNNPLIANQGHPIIERALLRATNLLEIADEDALPEIQATTGPGNLSRSIFEHAATLGGVESDLVILRDWDSLAVSKWPLSYRGDARNWRLSNQKRFRRNDK
jgi:mannosyltransferase OCH1-like enzyme